MQRGCEGPKWLLAEHTSVNKRVNNTFHISLEYHVIQGLSLGRSNSRHNLGITTPIDEK